MLSRHPNSARGNDLYETPEVATLALLLAEPLPRTIWEPACGPGPTVRVLHDAGHRVIATDLIDCVVTSPRQGGTMSARRRRLMQKLADHVDRVTQADRLFIEHRPGRQHRVRLASRAEVNQRELFDGKSPLIPPGRRPFTPHLNRAAVTPDDVARCLCPAQQGELQMSKDEKNIELPEDNTPNEPSATDSTIPPETAAELDEEEKEFRALRRDLPGVKGSSAAGIVAISVGKAPTKNEFFRVHPDFRPIIPLVDIEVGMEKQFFAVASNMVEPLSQIGITVSDHALYLTVTSRGAYRIVPVRTANADGDQNEYARTKEIGLIQGLHDWVRLYTDLENRAYKVFQAPAGRFGEPQFPDLKPAKIFKLAFRDKGRLIDSTEHPLFLKWAARDIDK